MTDSFVPELAPGGPEPPATPTPTPTPEPGDDHPMSLGEARKLRRESAALRARAKAAEDDNERLITQNAALSRREVEHAAASVLYDPSDVWRVDPDVQQSFYDEQFGEVVGDKVREAAAALAASKPHLAKPPTAPPPSDRPIEGLRAGARVEEKPVAPTWHSALHGG